MYDLKLISDICGWFYVVTWGFVAYPQIFLNYKLKSVEGFKLDYPFLNISGFAFCSIAYSVAFFGKNLPYDNYGYGTIRDQDLVFVYHNLFTSLILILQSLIYKRGDNKVSLFSIMFTIFAWTSSLFLFFVTEMLHLIPPTKNFNVFMYLGYLKIIVTLTKYAPLAIWNYKRKSVAGFSFTSFAFDFMGGTLSMTQELIDYYIGTTMTLNPIKLGLGLITCLYDVLLMGQFFYYDNLKPLVKIEDKKEFVELP